VQWIDVVDISAPGVDWRTRLTTADVLFVSGGNTFHLLDQVRQTGFDVWLRANMQNKVYVGVSAGTIIATPTIEIAEMPPGDPNLPGLSDVTGLGLVNFEIEPHCDKARFSSAETYASSRLNPVYGLDDASAIVVDGDYKVVSEGIWNVFGGGQKRSTLKKKEGS
jgi:dipeptidase E